MNQKEKLARILLRSWVTLHGTYLQHSVVTAQIDLARELEIIDENEADMIIAAVLGTSDTLYGDIQDFIYRTLGIW